MFVLLGTLCYFLAGLDIEANSHTLILFILITLIELFCHPFLWSSDL